MQSSQRRFVMDFILSVRIWIVKNIIVLSALKDKEFVGTEFIWRHVDGRVRSDILKAVDINPSISRIKEE